MRRRSGKVMLGSRLEITGAAGTWFPRPVTATAAAGRPPIAESCTGSCSSGRLRGGEEDRKAGEGANLAGFARARDRVLRAARHGHCGGRGWQPMGPGKWPLPVILTLAA